MVGVSVGVLVGVLVGVKVGVLVGVKVGVNVGVLVGVSVGVDVSVGVGVGGPPSTGTLAKLPRARLAFSAKTQPTPPPKFTKYQLPLVLTASMFASSPTEN